MIWVLRVRNASRMYAGAYHQRLRSQAKNAKFRTALKQAALLVACFAAGGVVYSQLPRTQHTHTAVSLIPVWALGFPGRHGPDSEALTMAPGSTGGRALVPNDPEYEELGPNNVPIPQTPSSSTPAKAIPDGYLYYESEPPIVDIQVPAVSPAANIKHQVDHLTSTQPPNDSATHPPREPGWVTEQRPLPDSSERSLTSHAYEEIDSKSMTPPATLDSLEPEVAAQLATRLVIAIGMGVHSGYTDVSGRGLISLPIFNTMAATFWRTAQPHHLYRFYFAFDHDDAVYEKQEWRNKVATELEAQRVAENAVRWHPEGYKEGTIDSSTLMATVHWVHCNYASKPAWAHSDAITAAFKEGADYAFRTNDDTEMPAALDWVDRFVLDLRSRPIPNLGVVGPACGEGANWILTHDFTHRTHAVIFGFHYPRALPDWSRSFINCTRRDISLKIVPRG